MNQKTREIFKLQVNACDKKGIEPKVFYGYVRLLTNELRIFGFDPSKEIPDWLVFDKSPNVELSLCPYFRQIKEFEEK